jgi:hypothetical protein
MDLDELHASLLEQTPAVPRATVRPRALVMKVGGKIFAIIAGEADP